MSNYIAAKQYFTRLKNHNNDSGISVMEEYEEIKKQAGEFIAARFLRDVYVGFQEELELMNG